VRTTVALPAEWFLSKHKRPLTVFVTAHNQYAVKAFDIHALYYLAKPAEPERLQASVSRVKDRIASEAALICSTDQWATAEDEQGRMEEPALFRSQVDIRQRD
jgi:DNA-binding LytR/AlgR family response regulator